MTATAVIDSPEFVFRHWIDDVLNTEFMDYAETDMTDAAVAVVGRLLTEEWRIRGYRMVRIGGEMFSRIATLEVIGNAVVLPTGAEAEPVWKRVAEQLDFDDIVTEAGLTREYAAFVRAQPDYNH